MVDVYSGASASLLDTLDCGVMILEPGTGRMLDASAQTARLFGMSMEEINRLGFGLLERDASPEQLAGLRNGLKAAAKGQPQALDMKVHDGLGREFWLELNLKLLSPGEGPVVVASLRDISRRKRALAQQERLHKALTKRVHELECLYSLFTVFAESGASHEEIFTKSLASIAGGWQYPDFACVSLRVDDKIFKTPNYRPSPWRQAAPIVVNKEKVGELEVAYLRQMPPADEGPFLVEERELIDAVAGRLARIIERRRTQEELRRERDFAKNLVETAQLIVLVLDCERRIIHFNPFLEKISGYRLHEVIGLDWFDTFRPAEHRDGGKTLFREVMATAQAASYLGHMLDRQGRLHLVEWSVRPLRDTQGEMTGLLCTGQDVTERQKMEEDLRRLAAAVEQAAESIIVTDATGVIQYVNTAFENLTGYSRREAMGQRPALLKSGVQGDDFYKAMWAKLLSGRVFKGTLVNRKKNGDLYDVECVISPIRDGQGRIVNFLSHQRDITQEKRLREHLRQSQKMEAIGTLAGGIAHDFNNILGAIIGYLELGRLQLDHAENARGYLDQALKASGRAKDLVRQILTFSRRTEQQMIPVDLNLIAKESLKLLRATLPSTIEMHLQTLPNPASTLADPTHMHQVIMNLCTNAAHAMCEGGGKLEIALRDLEVGNDEAPHFPDVSPGSYLRLSVSDNGRGMSAEVREHIFEPFFTTKAPGEGTGLGLAVVHGIVKACRGAINVYSEIGKGTAVHIMLPRLPHSQAVMAEHAGEAPSGQGRLLLVDDEESLVDILGRMLEGLGYQVAAFRDSLKALEAFDADPSAFDLVISDLTMPGLTGLDLIRRMKAMRPDLPFLLCTGFSESITQEAANLLGVREVILKPVLRKQMAEAIQRALLSVRGG